jgi:hypothetical protein
VADKVDLGSAPLAVMGTLQMLRVCSNLPRANAVEMSASVHVVAQQRPWIINRPMSSRTMLHILRLGTFCIWTVRLPPIDGYRGICECRPAFVQLGLQAGMQIRSALLGEATAQERSACVRRPEPRVLRNGGQLPLLVGKVEILNPAGNCG